MKDLSNYLLLKLLAIIMLMIFTGNTFISIIIKDDINNEMKSVCKTKESK